MSSSAPVSKFSKLSLEGMAPTTRSQSHRLSGGGESSGQKPGGDDSSSEPESETGSSMMEDESQSQPAVIRSPTRLTYRIDDLPAETQATVREAFKEPPRIALQYCRLRDNVYAFQMTELKTLSIRIGAPDSSFPIPRCSCSKNSGEGTPPCKHLLWLLDQLVKQTMYDHDPAKPLTMTADGYAEELGHPFSDIAGYHLDILADGLRCQVVTPESDEDDEETINRHRVHEAREMLAAVASSPPDEYRPDIFSRPTAGKKVVKRNDLECTIFRMLLANNDFFHYFLAQMRSSDPVNDPFRKLEQRVQHVLQDLDAYCASIGGSSSADVGSAAGGSASSAEGPCNVSWAARHILGVVSLIRTAIYQRDRPLEAWEQASAARTLVRVLAVVCERNRDVHPGANRLERNLYLRLVGDRDRDFVVGVLALLPPDAASRFVHNLEDIAELLGQHGAPITYAEKFRNLVLRVRSASSSGGAGGSGSRGAGSKRQGQNQEQGRGPKRMK